MARFIRRTIDRVHKGRSARVKKADGRSMDTEMGSGGERPSEVFDFLGGPTEIRTRVSAVRGQRPWPLDDGAVRDGKIDAIYSPASWVG